jgi:hypothetical protein
MIDGTLCEWYLRFVRIGKNTALFDGKFDFGACSGMVTCEVELSDKPPTGPASLTLHFVLEDRQKRKIGFEWETSPSIVGRYDVIYVDRDGVEVDFRANADASAVMQPIRDGLSLAQHAACLAFFAAVKGRYNLIAKCIRHEY